MFKSITNILSNDKMWTLVFAAVVVTLIPPSSYALNLTGAISIPGAGIGFGVGTGGAGTIAGTLCTIVSWFTDPGGVGSAIASMAVIFLGIGAFFGKVTWGMALMFAAGIFSIFGAGDIVTAITGGIGSGCGGSSISIGF